MDYIEKYDLPARFDARASFYGKAVVFHRENGDIELRSYQTIVACIKGYSSPTATAEVYGKYSATTSRHIKEFLKQHGFKAENTAQILKDYFIER